MGGTLIKLVEQGHRVHVAYMTTGNVAVFDHDARRFLDFVQAFNRQFQIDPSMTAQVQERLLRAMASKQPGQPDHAEVLAVKRLIREAEARGRRRWCAASPPSNCTSWTFASTEPARQPRHRWTRKTSSM
jgi:glucosamine-6-phosphate deaminase